MIIRIYKGQTLCRSYDYSCKNSVLYDEGPPLTFPGVGPSDHSSETAFLEDPKLFIAMALMSKRIRVSLDIYQNGVQVLNFEPPESLRWSPKQ